MSVCHSKLATHFSSIQFNVLKDSIFLLRFVFLSPVCSMKIDLTGTKSTSMEVEPLLVTVAKSRQRRQVQSSPVTPGGDDHNLAWVTWKGSLPNDAVSIYNDYVGRTDYVCKYKCHPGLYDPSNKDPKCYYANDKKEHAGFPFEILVNKDDSEILEWKDDSYGSVPKNSVRTCPGGNIYVGKNKYGLGKVDTKDKVFNKPMKGSQYDYNDYQVLTVSENFISQEIYDVKFNKDQAGILKFPPEIVHKSTIRNHDCYPVVKTDTLTKTYEETQRWDSTSSIKSGVKTSITFGIPYIVSGGIEFNLEATFQYSSGSTVVNTITDTVAVEVTAPPNKSCSINMMRYKSKLTIPFSALLKRTYANGETRTTALTGTYSSVQVREDQVSLEKCELLEDSTICSEE